MRCQWMVEVQRLLGAGRFAKSKEEVARVAQEVAPDAGPEVTKKAKDIIKACELSD